MFPAISGGQHEPGTGIIDVHPEPPLTELESLDGLVPEVYDELCRLASNQLRRERRNHTLETAGLVNEAYLRMVSQNPEKWRSRSHFVSIAARMMRRVLVDHARRHRTTKRGGDIDRVSLDHVRDWTGAEAPDVLKLDEALRGLAEVDPQLARIVEFRFFGGLTHEQIAETLEVSTVTAKRRWKVARAWLYRALAAEDTGGS